MKHRWNEAIAAYDRELPLLMALRDEYLAYIRERVQAAARVAATEAGDRVRFGVPTEADANAEIVLTGDGEDSGLQCQFWPSAEEGGEPGRYVWAILMNRTLPPAYGDAKRAVGAARLESAAVATEPLDQAPECVGTFAGHELVRWGQLDLADPEFAARLARLFRAIASGMVSAGDALVALRAATPRFWMEGVLRELQSQRMFELNAAIEVKAHLWARVGYHIIARISVDDRCWFTACDDGCLAFHWDPPKAEKEARRRAVMRALDAASEFRKDGWNGVVLLDAAKVVELKSADDAGTLRTLILDTWRRYTEARSADSSV